MNTAVRNPMIEDYFSRLDAQMSDMPAADRQEFVRELRAHVLDRLDQVAVASDQDCRSVLQALGTPEEIARQYRLERILNRSAWKISPLSVLRTLLRWTLTGIQGYIVFMVAVLGYLLSAAFYITALLKPLFPHNVGLFVTNQGIEIARFPTMPPGTDLLGVYYIPVAVILGYLFTFGTTLLIRFIMRRFGQLKQKI